MKSREIREKTVEDIENDLLAAQENLRTLRFQLVTSQLENTSLIDKAKKEIAVYYTILREHELGINKLVDPRITAAGGDTK
jgi:large subunit ribosomal protein L29